MSKTTPSPKAGAAKKNAPAKAKASKPAKK